MDLWEIERNDIMKKLLSLILLIVVVLSLTACIEKPHEVCISDWELKMQTRQILIVSYTTYILETEEGDVVVSKKIYEAAQREEYSEICVLVETGEETTLVGATLIDGTALDQNAIDEIAEQVLPKESEEN